MNDDLARDLRERCTRFISGHGRETAAAVLADIPPDTTPDRYGDGGVVTQLETRIAALLNKPAAVFFPSGTMAQQVTLRVHAQHRGRSTVAFHPTCHLQVHEAGALERVQGLIGRPVGNADVLLTLDDLASIAEELAAVLIELPQREIGGQLPPLEELREQLAWAHGRGAATHLDGARLWEAAAGYGTSPGEIAALFDTVYVSFYKGIGALPGCCVAGEENFIAEVREWRKRMGGTLFALWPNAASAMTCLDRRLPRMPAYVDAARAIGHALTSVTGVRVVPDPPQTHMMHLLLNVAGDVLETNVRRLAEQDGIWTWQKAMPTIDPLFQRVELSVGDAALEWAADEVAAVLEELVNPG